MKRFLTSLILLACAMLGNAHAAATLLPPGESCFSANAPTSGGLYGPITTFGAISGGSSYVNGTYTNVALTGGSGFGAKATVTVSGNVVTSVALINPGSHYTAADTLSAATSTIGGGSGVGFSIPVNAVQTTGTGMVGALGTIIAGTGGASGTYGGVALTGGSGSGATANITVSGGGVTSITILNPGTQYQVGDTLTAASGNIGNVTGFSVLINSVFINSSLAGGSVAFYIPNTNTPKQTWANSAQTILNTNPVNLDQNGCAIIYGAGSYRQVLFDSLGNTVWDQITADTSSSNSTFWAGVAGGTPNVITVVDPGFNATDGTIINFTALGTNTTSATLNPSGFGNIPTLKDTTAGPVALTGGEIIQNNPISAIFRAADNSFHLLNTVIASANGATAPLCGATGLKITNSSVTPSTIISLTADQIVMQTAAGLTINRSNVSVTVNISLGNSTSTAGGMDGEAPGISQTINIWAIDNGAAPSAIGSLSATAPNQPSGYTYKCRLGTMIVDGSGNLYRFNQLGNYTSWKAAATSNTTGPFPIATATAGSTTTPTWVIVSIALMPPTATRADLAVQIGGSSAGTVIVAPSNLYAGYSNSQVTSSPPCVNSFNTTGSGIGLMRCIINMEIAQTVYWASSGSANNAVYIVGYWDKINAN